LEKKDLQDTIGALWAPGRGFAETRLRLLAALSATLLILALRPPGAVVLGLAAFAVAASSLADGRRSFLGLAAGISLLAVGLNALTEPGVALVKLGPLTVTGSGLVQGAERAARLLGLVGVARLVVQGLGADQLSDLAQRLAWPLERRSHRLAGLGLAMGIGVRFLPEVQHEIERIRLAQRARPPLPPGRGGPVRRILAIEPLFLPLLAGTVRRAEEVARTLDARGYGSGPRTSRIAGALGTRERWLAGLLVLSAGLILLGDRLR
jgi:energy-coupling factor transport system permease protein